MKELETVKKLIALAVDKGAAENERRNAALKAVELIHEHGLLETGGYVATFTVPRKTWTAPSVDPIDADSEYVETVIKGPPDGWERATADGRLCKHCRQPIPFGDLIPQGESSLHLRCWLKRRRREA